MKRKTKLLIRDAFLSTVLSCILLGVLALAFVNLRFFNPLHKAFEDFSFLDVYYSERFHDNAKINKDIILVNVEDHGRDVIALMLEAVLYEDPKVVGFDVILEEHREHFKADSTLARLLSSEKVVTSIKLDANGISGNEAFFPEQKNAGFVDFNYDDEKVIREFQGKIDQFGDTYWSFASQIAKVYLKPKKWDKYEYNERLSESQMINYIGNTEKFLVLGYDDIAFSETKPILKDKIVIFGYLGLRDTNDKLDLNDKFWTPLNSHFSGKTDRDMFGVVIHANIVNMLIKNDFIYKVPFVWLGLITFLCMFVSTMVYMKLNRYYKISYRTRKQTYQLIFSVLLLILVIWLMSLDIVLNPFIIIVGILLAGSYFKYYKHLVRYIKTKRKWKTYVK